MVPGPGNPDQGLATRGFYRKFRRDSPILPAFEEFRQRKNLHTARAQEPAITLLAIHLYNQIDAKVAELADAPDLGSGGATRGGSSPPFRTTNPLPDAAPRPASGVPRNFFPPGVDLSAS